MFSVEEYMKNRILNVALVSLLLLALLAGCGGKKDGEEARFLRVSGLLGKVEVCLVGGEFRPATTGMRLGEKDQVRTSGADSSCVLQTPGGSVVRMAGDSLLVMSKLYRDGKLNTEQTGLELLAGKVIVRAKKLLGGEEFSVRTKSATAGVRGTEFVVTVDDKSDTRVAVKHGIVIVQRKLDDSGKPLAKALQADSSVTVQASQQVTIKDEDNKKLLTVVDQISTQNKDADVTSQIKQVKDQLVKDNVDAQPKTEVFTIADDPVLQKDFSDLDAVPQGTDSTNTPPADGSKDGSLTPPANTGTPPADNKLQGGRDHGRRHHRLQGRQGHDEDGLTPEQRDAAERKRMMEAKRQADERQRLMDERKKKHDADNQEALDRDRQLRERKTRDDRNNSK